MPRLKKVELFPGYDRVREPDKEKLAELVLRAKGEKRSLSEFAEACGVNTSSLLRIINRKNTGAIADSIIVAIAMNADPQSGISSGNLFDAHGLAPKVGVRVQSRQELLVKIAREASTTAGGATGMNEALNGMPLRYSKIMNTCRDAVVNALLLKGFGITLNKERDIMNGPEFPYTADFVLKTGALKEEGLDRWAFSRMKRTGAALVFEPTSAFDCAFMDNPAERGIKLTFLTVDEAGFLYFKGHIRTNRFLRVCL